MMEVTKTFSFERKFQRNFYFTKYRGRGILILILSDFIDAKNLSLDRIAFNDRGDEKKEEDRNIVVLLNGINTGGERE